MAADAPTGDRRLDVREIEGAPFGDILRELNALDGGDTLVLVADFEPVPLYDLLATRGFAHETTRVADDEWYVLVERD